MNRNPLEELLEQTEDDLEFEIEQSAYERYRVEMDAKFKKLDSAETAELWRKAVYENSKAANDALVHSVLPLVPYLGRKLQAKYGRPRASEWDDCIQAGNLALLQAIRSWKPEKGSKLSTWAVRYVLRDIGRELDFLQGSEVERDRGQQDHAGDPASTPFEGNDGASDEGECAEQMERGIDIRTMHEHVAKLTEPQRNVVTLLLSGKSIADAARVLGITRQAAHALHERAIVELRKHMVH